MVVTAGNSFAQSSTWSEARVVAGDVAAGDLFGESVALSVDLALVGASRDADNGYDSGSAYVFRYDPASRTWKEEAKLVAPDGAAGDRFGLSVSLFGDRALVGAPHDDDLGSDSGSAYLFRHDPIASTWTEEAKLLASDGTADNRFGYSVSLDRERALVGADLGDGKVAYSGTAYLFRYDSGPATWIEEAKLVAQDGAAHDRFATSVSLSGERALIGADQDDARGYDSGAAYSFRFDPATVTWLEEAKLVPADGLRRSLFGCSVSLSEDRALVGAFWDDDNGPLSGSAYVFRLDPVTATWKEEAKLLASDGRPGDRFGRAVALSEDRALVGAHLHGDRGPLSGSAYSFRFDLGTQSWIEEGEILASDGAAYDSFGGAVSLSGDRALIGASFPFYASDVGSAYVYTPFLSASSSAFSASSGATIDLSLDFPITEADLPYAVLGSATGMGPTLLPGAVSVPLSPDTYFRRSLRGESPRNFRDAYGILDAYGDAECAWTIPGGASTAWVGRTVWLAVVSYRRIGSFEQASRSSHAAALSVTP